jgi:hypothetical protein
MNKELDLDERLARYAKIFIMVSTPDHAISQSHHDELVLQLAEAKTAIIQTLKAKMPKEHADPFNENSQHYCYNDCLKEVRQILEDL